MANPMHKEIFEYYKINETEGLKNNEKFKRALRKYILTHFNECFPNETWDKLSEYQKKDFIVLKIKDHVLEAIDNHATNPKRLIEQIEVKINHDIHISFEALDYIEQHNKEIEILCKQFYKPDATEKENQMAYYKFVDYHKKYFPTETPPTLEEWLANPIRLLELRDAYMHDNQRKVFETPSTVSKEQVTDEIIKCILHKLHIKIDTESIINCIAKTRDAEYLMHEGISLTNSKELEVAECLRKLQEHDFIIYEK